MTDGEGARTGPAPVLGLASNTEPADCDGDTRGWVMHDRSRKPPRNAPRRYMVDLIMTDGWTYRRFFPWNVPWENVHYWRRTIP